MKLKPFFNLVAVATLATFVDASAAEKSSALERVNSADFGATKELADLPAKLLSATTRHLDSLIDSSGKVANLKGKSATGMTALAFYLTYEATGKPEYRTAALRVADGILAEMKATKFGVLFVKEKEKGGSEEIDGGGPPALGWYASALAYIYHREGGKDAELIYVAGVLDRFPWNEKGWWAATIDIRSGEPKLPLSKPSPINKTAAMAMAAGMAADYVKDIDSALATRLRGKAEYCIYRQIIPAQEADGFWHYNLNGRDPKEKDVFGYFMLTAGVLFELQQLTGSYRDEALVAAQNKAGGFARVAIAPMTEPNRGSASRERATHGTPLRFTLAEDLKRTFQLGVVLIGAGENAEGRKIADAALKHFPFGNRGDDGAHSVYSTALLHRFLTRPIATLGKPVESASK
jgi:hypothetical protein